MRIRRVDKRIGHRGAVGGDVLCPAWSVPRTHLASPRRIGVPGTGCCRCFCFGNDDRLDRLIARRRLDQRYAMAQPERTVQIELALPFDHLNALHGKRSAGCWCDGRQRARRAGHRRVRRPAWQRSVTLKATGYPLTSESQTNPVWGMRYLLDGQLPLSTRSGEPATTNGDSVLEVRRVGQNWFLQVQASRGQRACVAA
jgi:hypothetical protein